MPAKTTRLPVAFLLAILALVATPLAASAQQAPVRIAAAANFKLTAEHLAAEFAKDSKELMPVVSSGATGLLYSQIVQGAPFDVFFAADAERPARLEREGRTVPGTRFTYGTGKLVAWRPGRPWAGTLQQALKAPEVKVVALANPAVAPYGVAAQQVLGRLGLSNRAPFRIVQGESLGQTFQFVATGNAQIGFVALAQIIEIQADRPGVVGEILEIDPVLHDPIAQEVVLIKRAAANPVARRFLDFVRSSRGQAIIAAAGYTTR